MKNSAARNFFAVFLLLAFSGCQPAGEPVGPPVRLGEEVKNLVSESLAGLKDPVTLHLYEGGGGETAQRETRALLEFVAEASPKVSLSFHSLEEGPSAADFRSSLGVSHGPVVAIEGTADRGPFLFYGFPERKELKPFLDGVVIASGVTATLPAEVEIFLAALQRETVIRIFTAPD